jgi:NAD(P)-dependent dehydrogenase (short-subunit alcohol dehydrogenase family)
MPQFNATSTTSDVIQGVSLAGKSAVITGASSGLGVETARTLANAGAKVLLLARDKEKVEAVAQQLRDDCPGASISTATMDLADLDSVRNAAQQIVADMPSINLLINNAGVMACPLGRTAQGFEMQFGTNHMGHFLLSCLLAPSLIAASSEGHSARVICLSSAGHRRSNVDFDDPNYEHRDYEKWAAYGQSKTANALFALGFDNKLCKLGVRAFAVHPGVIMTELSRHMVEDDYALLSSSLPEGETFTFKSVEQGAATSIWAATTSFLEYMGGVYLEDCYIADAATSKSSAGVESYAVDHAAADRLWDLSEELAGQTFNF